MNGSEDKNDLNKHIERLDKVISDSKILLKNIPTLRGKVEIVKSLKLLEDIKLYFEKNK